jgi:hypothetical protein
MDMKFNIIRRKELIETKKCITLICDKKQTKKNEPSTTTFAFY